MAKMKTHSGAKKRFKKLSSGKVKRSKAFRRHLLTRKETGRKRHLRNGAYFKPCDMDHLAVLLPY